MNENGGENEIDGNSLQKASGAYQNPGFGQAYTSQRRDTEKLTMETLGRGFSDLYRNSSEELALKSLMENPVGFSAPSMEMLGFKNMSQTFRGDSEELFNTWLMNGEIPGYSPTSIVHRTRQASRRISTEIAVATSQNEVAYQKKAGNDVSSPPNIDTQEEHSSDSQHSLRNAADKGMQTSNLYLAKAWFHSSQPMTRSRSSELRRIYAAMQNLQSATVLEAPKDLFMNGTSIEKQGIVGTSNFYDASMGEMSRQPQTFLSSSNSSTSPFNTPPVATVDTVSSVVNMLKGTLERKKCSYEADKETMDGSSFEFYNFGEAPVNFCSARDTANHIVEPQGTFQLITSAQMNGRGSLPIAGASLESNIEGYVTSANQVQMGTVSEQPSQSESSAAAPVISTGFEVCDGPAHSGQTLSVCESSRKHIGDGTSEHASEFGERIFENNSKEKESYNHRKGNLVRMGSVTSCGSVEKADPTKKRRVERSRKIAEAKERNLTPTVPSDMQSILKRCENLEKEVRSLKLNLSFMNRKDSEQTKQIEELQRQNDELAEEKERLLEEIERIISVSGGM